MIEILVFPVHEAHIPYMISGAMAAVLYGVPRFTQDIDVVLHLDVNSEKKFRQLFPEDAFYIPPEEVLLSELSRHSGGHFNVIHHDTGYRADIYLTGRDSFQQWGLKNRRKITYREHDIFVAPVQYVIIKKLEYFKEGGSQKHLDDIALKLVVASNNIDCLFLE